MTKTEVYPGEVTGDCGDDNRDQIENPPQVGEMDPWNDLGRGGTISLIDIVDEVELAELKKEVLECVEPRFRGIPFMDDEELLAGLFRMREQGQDPRFPIKRTKNAKLIYDGKNAELKGRIIRRKWPELAVVLQYDDTTDDSDTATLDHAFNGRIGRGSLGKSDRAFQAVEAYLRQKENKQAIKIAGGRLKSQQQIAAEKGVSATYVEDLLRVHKKSKKLYALVGERKIKVKSAAEIADDEDENTRAGVLILFEGCPHLTDDKAHKLLGEYRAAKASRKKHGRTGAANNQSADANGAETSDAPVEQTGQPNAGRPPVDPQIGNDDGGSTRAGDAARTDPVPSSTPDRPNEQAEIERQGACQGSCGAKAGDGGPIDLGVFKGSVDALVHLQKILSDHPATPQLVEALETTLNAARESCRE